MSTYYRRGKFNTENIEEVCFKGYMDGDEVEKLTNEKAVSIPYDLYKNGPRTVRILIYTTDSNGKLVPKRDVDFTDHGRPSNHPNPHQHRYIENSTGGTMKRSKNPEPLESQNEEN